MHLLYNGQFLRTQTILKSYISHYDTYVLILYCSPSATTMECVCTHHRAQLGQKQLCVPPAPLTKLIKTSLPS